MRVRETKGPIKASLKTRKV